MHNVCPIYVFYHFYAASVKPSLTGGTVGFAESIQIFACHKEFHPNDVLMIYVRSKIYFRALLYRLSTEKHRGKEALAFFYSDVTDNLNVALEIIYPILYIRSQHAET